MDECKNKTFASDIKMEKPKMEQLKHHQEQNANQAVLNADNRDTLIKTLEAKPKEQLNKQYEQKPLECVAEPINKSSLQPHITSNATKTKIEYVELQNAQKKTESTVIENEAGRQNMFLEHKSAQVKKPLDYYQNETEAEKQNLLTDNSVNECSQNTTVQLNMELVDKKDQLLDNMIDISVDKPKDEPNEIDDTSIKSQKDKQANSGKEELGTTKGKPEEVSIEYTARSNSADNSSLVQETTAEMKTSIGMLAENTKDTTPSKTVKEITAVDSEKKTDQKTEPKTEGTEKQKSPCTTAEKEALITNLSNTTNVDAADDKPIPKATNDVIEIDDDEDDTCPFTLKITESSKTNEGACSLVTHETIGEKANSQPADSDFDCGNKTFVKMRAMPIIFYKKECINFECPKNVKEFHRAPQFALNYFKVSKKKPKTQYICGGCYDLTLSFFQEFCGLLEAKQPILLQKIINKKQEFVEILDSSDEEETEETANLDYQEKENTTFSKTDLDLIEVELENTIRKVFDKIDIQNQLTWTKTIFTERVKNLQQELEYVDAELSETQKVADRMYYDLYDSGKYRINTLKPLDLDSENDRIPPLGEVERPSIKIESVYYAARNKAIGCWIGCKIIEQVDTYLSVPHFRVKFLSAQFQPFKILSAKLIAYYDPPAVRLSVGQRVIAYYDGTTLTSNDVEKNLVKSAFYPGIIAEEIKPNNSYRYLIFYDDGYTQYVSHKDVRLVCHVARNVWEDVDNVSREFIKKYVQEYRVNRPMVQTHKGQKMTTEKNGRWVPARVIDIDCSLVRMQFEGSKGNHTEWIYRGSLRLNPVYMEYQKSKNNAVNNQRAPLSRVPRRTEPFIRYTDDEETFNTQHQLQQQLNHQEQQLSTRSFTRLNSSSSAASPSTPTVRHLNANTIYLEDEKPKGKVIYYTAKRQMPTRVYRPHNCGIHCLIVIPHNLNGYNPLAKPLLSGWERLFSRQKIKKTVYYRAPCGKMFRNMHELHQFLRVTKCSLNVDNFDFFPETSCLAEFEAENVHLKKRDISNGQERMPLPLINYYDETLPECTYSATVIPTEGVNINTDPEFLICCECEDDCVDKSKCACWNLTIEGVKTTNPDAQVDDIGYQYKRLYDHLPTGIYECNSRCKCKSHCLNRVVQHSLGLKLQVFKTTNRGWGLRCLNDIPRGSFVCVYAGNLLTEAKANEGGLDAGDEYFAELDYIETVEQLKEGYESDVDTQEDEDDEDTYEPEPEDDADFQPSKSTERRVRRGTAGGSVSTNEGERQAINFNPKVAMEDDTKKKRLSVRQLFGKDEAVYVMDAKVTGNLGRYFNHSCSPNLFVQNVFVDTHDIRFPCVAFFSSTYIRAGTELTWNYNYEVGVVPGKVLYCQCGAPNCRQRLL